MTTKTDKPATSEQAEDLARHAVQQYLNACQMTHRAQMGNYLMKLCSVAGVVMANAEGSESAALRLEGTADFVRNKMPAQPAKLEKLQ